MQLRQVFDDLVRFETMLWTALDAALLEQCSVSLGALNALLVVERTPDCRVNDLARALSITVGGASQAVDRFEKQGLLARNPNPANRRSSLLQITAAGRAALGSASTMFDAELDAWLAFPLGAARATRFAKDLASLRAAADARLQGADSGIP